MDIGRDFPHVTQIYPFKDNPTVGVSVLFFPVPMTTDFVPYEHPFVLRNWDRLEEEDVPDFGTKYDAKTYYYGPLPINLPGNVCGTAAQWMGEIDYTTWLAGGYSCTCPAPIMPTFVSTVRCDDGSLVVSPHNGDVEVHLNVGHQNDWTANQIFQGEVVVQSNLFEVANVIPAPVHNLTTVSLVGVDDGSGFLDVNVVAVGGTQQYDGYLAIRPNQSGGVTTFELSSSGAAFQDTALVLFDSTNTPQTGQTGTPGPGHQVYGGVVVNLGYNATAPTVYDQFHDANGTNLPSHAIAPTNTPATAWTVTTGTLHIDTNRLHAVTTAVSLATCDPGLTDVNCSITFTFAGTGVSADVVFRGDLSSNYLSAQMSGTALNLVQYTSGTASILIGTAFRFGTTTGTVILRVRAKGNALTATLETQDGVVLCAAYFETSVYGGNTRCGVRCNNPVTDLVSFYGFRVLPS